MKYVSKITKEVIRPFHQLYHFIATKLLLCWAQRQLQKRDPRSLSFAVVSRLTVIELPYIRSFIDYYLSLGVSVLYFINTHPPEFEEISTYLDDYIFQGRVQLYNVVGEVHVNESQNQLLPKVKEDFIINVDIDEYMLISPHDRLHDFVAKNAMSAYYYMKWVYVPNDVLKSPTIPYQIYPVKLVGKYMVYRSIISQLRLHDPIFIHRGTYQRNTRPKHAELLHFFSRTFNDTLLKIVSHNISGSTLGSTTKTELLTLLEQSDIPMRLKYLAWLMCIKHQTLDSVQREILQVDYELEQVIIERYLTHEEITRIYAVYQRFKAKLNTIDLPLHLEHRKDVCDFMAQLKF